MDTEISHRESPLHDDAGGSSLTLVEILESIINGSSRFSSHSTWNSR